MRFVVCIFPNQKLITNLSQSSHFNFLRSWQRSLAQLSEEISKLNNQMDDFTHHMEELTNNLTSNSSSPTSQLQLDEASTSSYSQSGSVNGSPTGHLLPSSFPSTQLPKGLSLTKEVPSFFLFLTIFSKSKHC